MIAAGVTVHVVEREPESLPFVLPLLRRLMEVEFEPAASRAALDQLLRDPRSGASEELLDRTAIDRDGPLAAPALLFPAADWSLRVVDQERNDAGLHRRIRFDDSSAAEVARLLRLACAGASDVELRDAAPWLDPRLRAGLASRPAASPPFPPVRAPGIYRREHGCAVLRSRTTTVVLDPVALWMPHAPRAPIGGVDAVLVTHGHADHWSIPSILAQAGSPDTPVIVPPVPRTSILAPNDMLGALRRFGQAALAPPWGSSLEVGDIRVDVLPFYGEQPTRDGAGPSAELRNWGSCYRLTSPELSLLALIDSGTDPAGSMVDVARASRERHGPVDLVLSSLPRFFSPFFAGLPHYYLSLPFGRLRELHGQLRRGRLPSITPGPAGVAALCQAAGARHYRPYGNGFDGVGRPIGDVGIAIGEPPEEVIVRDLAARFAAAGLATTPIAWRPGDAITLEGGRARHLAAADLSR